MGAARVVRFCWCLRNLCERVTFISAAVGGGETDRLGGRLKIAEIVSTRKGEGKFLSLDPAGNFCDVPSIRYLDPVEDKWLDG